LEDGIQNSEDNGESRNCRHNLPFPVTVFGTSVGDDSWFTGYDCDFSDNLRRTDGCV
jgi:hypothetical protein